MPLRLDTVKRVQRDFQIGSDVALEFFTSLQRVINSIKRLSEYHDFDIHQFSEELDLLFIVSDKVTNKIIEKNST